MPADLRRFKTLTLGKPVIMGRKTFESIGRPLPDRTNIVVSASANYRAPGCLAAADLAQALALGRGDAGDAGEVMIIGGTSLFAAGMTLAARMYLTLIHHRFGGDAYFPPFDAAEWREIARRDFPAGAGCPYAYSFVDLERIGGAA